MLDSRNLYDVLRFDLPPPTQKPGVFERAYVAIRTWFSRGTLPLYRELGPQSGKSYEEIGNALQGFKSSMVRINERGEVIVSVAVPVQRFRAVRGALMLSTQGADIDNMVGAERLAIFKVFLIAAGVMVLLSFLLAGTIAGPVRRLAESAKLVRRRIRSRVEIPDLSHRRDEIGHLSVSLRDMTDALYSRIEAIERFAADVAHELKNPLTSLRSAVETLPLARSDESRGRLLAVIQHDVKRLDRLISDISDASRLDAEMQRHDAQPVDLTQLLTTVVSVANERHDDGVTVELKFEDGRPPAFIVLGHDSRLGQVIDNLIDNARSFSPAGRVRARHLPATEERDRDRRRRRRPGRAGGGVREDLRALLHASPAPGLRPELRPRPVDLQTDHRGPRRTHLGGEPPCCRARRQWRAASAGRAVHRTAAGNVIDGASVHASAVLVGARAVLIRGPAGAGKSRLALDLLTAAQIRPAAICAPGRR